MRRTMAAVFCSASMVFILSSGNAMASPPASPYSYGSTLNPACAPGDANCTVSAPTLSLILASGSSTGANDIMVSAGKLIYGAHGASINLDNGGDGGVKISPATNKLVDITSMRAGQATNPILSVTDFFKAQSYGENNSMQITDDDFTLTTDGTVSINGDTTWAAGKKLKGSNGAYIDLNYGGTGGIELKPVAGQSINFNGDLSVSSLVNAAQPDGRIDLGNITRIQGEYGLIRLGGSGETGGAEGAYIYSSADGVGPYIRVADTDPDPNVNGAILLSAPTTTITGNLNLSALNKKMKLNGGELQGNGEAVEIRTHADTGTGSAIIVGPDANYLWDTGGIVAYFGSDGEHQGANILTNLTMLTSGKKIYGAHGANLDLDADGVGNINLKPAAGKAVTLDNDVNLDTTMETLTLGRFGTFAENGDRIVINHDNNTINLHSPLITSSGDIKLDSGKKILGQYASIDVDHNSGISMTSGDNSSIDVEEHIYLNTDGAIFLNNNTELAAGKILRGATGAYLDLNYGGTGGIELKPVAGQPIRFNGDLGISSLVNPDQMDGRLDLGLTTRLTGEYGLIRLSGGGETGGAEGAYIYGDADGSHNFIQVEDWDTTDSHIYLSAPTTSVTGDILLSTSGKGIYGPHSSKIDLDKNSNGTIKIVPASGKRVFVGDTGGDWGSDNDLLTVKGNLYAYGSGRFDNGVGIANDGEAEFPLTVEGNMSVDDIQFNGKNGQGTGRISNIFNEGFVVSAEANDNLILKGSNNVSLGVMGGEFGIWLTAPTTTISNVLDTKNISHRGDLMIESDELPGVENGNFTLRTHYGSEIVGTDEGIWLRASDSMGGPEIMTMLLGRDGVTSFTRGTVLVSNSTNFTHRLNGDNSNMFQVYSEGGWSSFEARNEYTQMSGECGTVRIDCAENGTRVNGNLKVDGSEIKMPNLPVFADNAAAIAGGLTAGTLYRTGGDPDVIAVVH